MRDDLLDVRTVYDGLLPEAKRSFRGFDSDLQQHLLQSTADATTLREFGKEHYIPDLPNAYGQYVTALFTKTDKTLLTCLDDAWGLLRQELLSQGHRRLPERVHIPLEAVRTFVATLETPSPD